MYKISWDDVLKCADEMGIKYTLNSKNPGFYAVEENGDKRKIKPEELLFLTTLT